MTTARTIEAIFAPRGSWQYQLLCALHSGIQRLNWELEKQSSSMPPWCLSVHLSIFSQSWPFPGQWRFKALSLSYLADDTFAIPVLIAIFHTEKFPPIPSYIFSSPQPQAGKELHLASLCDPGQASLPLLDSVFLAVVPVRFFWRLFCLCYPMWLQHFCSLLWLSWEPDLMEIIFLKLIPLLPCV